MGLTCQQMVSECPVSSPNAFEKACWPFRLCTNVWVPHYAAECFVGSKHEFFPGDAKSTTESGDFVSSPVFFVGDRVGGQVAETVSYIVEECYGC
tara:strand:+ start:15376 stop:15660 length:285 start_codon:yes stop_codon:yes gene_type:complete